MSATNKEIVEEVNASFAEGGGGVDGFLLHCAEDVVWNIVGDKTVKGKNAIREWMASMDIEPPKFTVNNILADGDSVAAYGDMIMKEKDGKTAPYSFCDIYHFREGRIVEMNSFVIKTEAKAETASGV